MLGVENSRKTGLNGFKPIEGGCSWGIREKLSLNGAKKLNFPLTDAIKILCLTEIKENEKLL